MGALIGGFLIGRPYPLFHKMFEYAASTHNPFYGALSFILVALGNIVVMALLFLALSARPVPALAHGESGAHRQVHGGGPAYRGRLHLLLLGGPAPLALRVPLVPHHAVALT